MGISFERVSYSYHDGGTRSALALDALDLDLAEHRMIAVLGSPGSGKSTLLQQLNGLLQPDVGRIRVLDYVLEATMSDQGGSMGTSGSAGTSIHMCHM